MGRNEQLYVVAYDITDARRLRRVARKLEGAGWRMQHSVFHCRLDPAQLNRLVKELNGLIDALEDCIRIYPVCGHDSRNIHMDGLEKKSLDKDYYLV